MGQAKEMKTLNLKPAKEEASVKTPPSRHPLLHPVILLTALMTLNGLWYNTRGVVLGSLYKQKSQSGRVLKKTAFFSFFLSPSLPSVPPFFSFFFFFFLPHLTGSDFPDQGWNPHSLHCYCGVLATGLPGKSQGDYILVGVRQNKPKTR